MPGPPLSWPALFAQNPPADGGPSSFFVQLLPFLPVVVLFYLLIIRPQQTQERKRQEMIRAIRKNDRVETSGGMIGTVISVDDANNRVVLRLGEDDRTVKVAFVRSSVLRVVDGSPEKSEKAAETA